MNRLIFNLETITPMFLAGAEQNTSELRRPPSFKGLLRFWWRAYYWGNNPEKLSPDELQKRLKEREGEIFGTSADNGCKSHFSLRIKEQNIRKEKRKFPFVLRYLAYGAEQREYICPGSTFSLIANLADETVQPEIVRSVYLLSAFGGIGAKSRNGFGNFIVKNHEIFDEYHLPYPFPEENFFKKYIVNGQRPDFSAFSTELKLFKLTNPPENGDALDCLTKLGEIYKQSKRPLDKPLKCEKRQYIAAPIAVKKKFGKKWETLQESFLKRRAKPYFFHVVKTKKGVDGYILYLPSEEYCHQGIPEDKDEKQVNEEFHASCQTFNENLVKSGEMTEVKVWQNV